MDGKEECVVKGFILSDYPGHLKLYRRYDGYTDMGEYLRIPGGRLPRQGSGLSRRCDGRRDYHKARQEKVMDPFFDFQYPDNLMDRAAWTRNEQRAMQKLERLKILYDTGFHHDAGMAWLAEQITKYISAYELRDRGFRKNKKPPKFPGTGELMKQCFLKFGGRKECLEKYLKGKEEDSKFNLPQNPEDLILVNGYYFPKMDQEFRMKCKVAEFLCNIIFPV